MKKTKVYWAYNNTAAFNDVVGYPPERLLTALKKDPLFRDMPYGDILSCPATLDQIRNTYVLRSPVDMINVKQDNGDIHTMPMGLVTRPNDYVHLDQVTGWYFFSEVSTILSATPPYLHPEGLVGAAGNYDISKWFRQVHPSIMVESGHVEIKRGQPVVYVSFDKPVELIQFDLTDRLFTLANMSASIKHTIPRLSLEYLYQNFKKNKTNKLVLNEIKRSLL